jgi:hypothetical protein
MINISKNMGLLACIVALVGAPVAHAAGPPPLSAYGELPSVEDMDLSIDGKHVAAITTIAGERAVVMLDDQSRLIRMIAVGDKKVRSIQWIGNDSVLVISTRTEDLPRDYYVTSQTEISQATVLPVAEEAEGFWIFGGQRQMFDAVFGYYGQRNTGDRWTGYFGGVEYNSSRRGTPWFQPSLYAIDMADNTIQRIARPAGSSKYATWIVAPDGTLAATFTMDVVSADWTIEGPRGKVIAKGTTPRDDAGLVALGADGTSVIYQEIDRQADKTRRFEVPLEGGAAPVEFLPNVEIDRLFIDQPTGRLLGYRVGDGKREYKFFAAEHQAAIRKIVRAFPQSDMRLSDWTPDLSKALVRVSGNGDIGTWYLVDVAQLSAHPIGIERTAIPPEQVGPISTVVYKAATGSSSTAS